MLFSARSRRPSARITRFSFTTALFTYRMPGYRNDYFRILRYYALATVATATAAASRYFDIDAGHQQSADRLPARQGLHIFGAEEFAVR